jgi:hypothetical protein
MNSKRVHLLLIGLLLSAVAVLIGGTYGINSLLESQSQQVVAVKAKVNALQQQQTNLTRSKKEIAKYAELYSITKTIVPENKDQAETVRQIVKIANQNSISIGSITFPASTLGANGPKTPPAAASGSAPVVPTKPLSGAGDTKINLSQLQKVPSIQGVYVLQINMESDKDRAVTYPQLISFLDGIEHNRLTAEVTNIEITPSTDKPGTFTFSLILNGYIKP